MPCLAWALSIHGALILLMCARQSAFMCMPSLTCTLETGFTMLSINNKEV